jgi:hypothetical protein
MILKLEYTVKTAQHQEPLLYPAKSPLADQFAELKVLERNHEGCEVYFPLRLANMGRWHRSTMR